MIEARDSNLLESQLSDLPEHQWTLLIIDETNVIVYRTINKGIVYALRNSDFMTDSLQLNVFYLSYFINITLL